MADSAASLNTLAQEVFGTAGVPDLVPNACRIQNLVKFSEAEKMGLKFTQTVRLAYPQGFTYLKGDGTAGVTALKDVVGSVQARAEISGSQIILRDLMSYEDAMKLSTSKSAFKKGSLYFLEGMQKAFRKRLEMSLMTGSSGIARSSGSTNIDATSTTVTINASYWASGAFSGMEGAKIQFYKVSDNALISSSTDAIFSITSVDAINKKIVVTGTATGITALDSFNAACYIYFNGAYGNEMVGLHSLLNTTSGDVFGISATTYSLWRATQFAPTNAGPLSYDKVKKAVARAVGQGLDDDCTLIMSPGAWEDVSNNLAALVRYAGKDKAKYSIGAEALEIFGQNGKLTILPSIFCWEGFAYGLHTDSLKRVGASDVTFNVPGVANGEMFFNLPGYNAIESRAMCHQAIFTDQPGKHFAISNIVNGA